MKNFGKTLLLLALVAFSQTLYSQHRNQYVNSGATIKAALQLCDSNKYTLAIDTLLTVDKSDTGYVATLTELAYSYMMANKYNEAVKTCNKALKNPSPIKHRLILIKGNAYDQWGYPDSSLIVYNEALKTYPYSYLIYYNMGVTYMNNHDYKPAITAFQQAIMLNPYHASSHLWLGKLMARMGQYAHAMLSLETFLLIEPSSNRSNANLVFLNSFVNNAMESDFETIQPTVDNKAFSETDQLIKSAVAMNKNYKVKVEFDAAVNRQTQLLFELLEYRPNTGDFWMEYYVPMFVAVKQNNHTEDLICNIMSTVPDKDFSKQVLKRQKTIKAMNSLLSEHLIKQVKGRKVEINGKDQVVNFYLNDDNGVLSFGYTDANDKRTGPWRFFHSNFEIEQEGEYDTQGNLTGEWKNYDENGILYRTENYAADKLHGDYTGFYPSGNTKYKAKYNNGNVQGDVTYYYDCDAVSSIVHFDNDKKNGKTKAFYRNGSLSEEYAYVNDSLEGENKAYYPDGTLKWLYYYKNNKLEGKTLFYHENGTTATENTYVSGVLNGTHTEYYDNGQISTTGEYKAGKSIGLWKEFDNKGHLTQTINYNEKGAIHGEDKGWDEDGKLYYIFHFDNGTTRDFTYYDKTGNASATIKLSDKKTPVKGYFPDGKLLFEGYYTKGKMDGLWTYYYKSGIKEETKNYTLGLLNGPYVSYDKCGRIMVSCNYKDGEQDGYYKKYYANGTVESEGWFSSGDAEGKWYYWHPDGKINKTLDFLSNQSNGFEESYAPDQKLQFKSGYTAGDLSSIVEYDSLGNEITNLTFIGKQSYTLHYFDKKVRLNADYTCNEFNNKFQFLSKTGKVESENNYLNGLKNGKYISYFHNGSLRIEGTYKSGDATGLWNYYYENGGVSKTGNFKDDKKDSIWKAFYENGKLKSIILYKNGEPIDTAKYYDALGELMYTLVFDKYGLVSYQYISNTGMVSKAINPKDTGIITTYFKNGKLSAELTYKYGVLEGKQTLYYSNGNKYQEYNLRMDDLDGNAITYYENGKIKKSETLLLSLNHGTFKFYRPDGTLEHSEDYRYDDEHGKFIYYDQQGKVTKVTRYWGAILLD